MSNTSVRWYPDRPRKILTWFSVIWLLLFTLLAVLAQYQVWSGRDLLAAPDHAYLSPFTQMAFPLGTDHLGRDVASYLFYSSRTAWLLTFPPLLVSTFLGVAIGTAGALIGSQGLQVKYRSLLAAFFTFFLSIYFWPFFKWTFIPGLFPSLDSPSLTVLLFGLFLSLCFLLIRFFFSVFSIAKRSIRLDVDGFLQKIINVWSSFPKLLLLLLLTSFTPFSLFTLMGWICATYWVLPARVARALVLHIKQEPFYEATTSLGLPFKNVLYHHVWPFLKGPIITNFCFAASGLLGIGSTLAYLGIGIPADVPSWGKLLATARYSLEAWWLFVFPSLLLLLSIFSLQKIGHVTTAPNKPISVTK